jgi:hypothetical protein
MTLDKTRVAVGMDVVSPTGASIGRVKEVRVHDFLIDIPMHRDIYAPFSAVREAGGRSIVLSLEPDAIGDQGWEFAPLLGGALGPESTVDRSDVVAGTGDPAQRGTWSAASDAYSLEPLDTRAGRLATSGADDGELPAGGARPSTESSSTARSTDEERLRDMSG